MNIRWFLRNGLCRRSNNYCTAHQSTMEHCNPITKLCILGVAPPFLPLLHLSLLQSKPLLLFKSMQVRHTLHCTDRPHAVTKMSLFSCPSLNNNIIMSEFNWLRTTCLVPLQNSSSVIARRQWGWDVSAWLEQNIVQMPKINLDMRPLPLH